MLKKQIRTSLFNEVQQKSMLLSIVSILFVQLILIVILIGYIIQDATDKAAITTDEAVIILREPMYNIDDNQAKLIGSTILSADRISGIEIDTSASGIILSKIPQKNNFWLIPQSREINYKDFYLGKITLYFSEDEIVKNIQGLFLVVFVVIVTFLFTNLLANKFLIGSSIRKALIPLSKGINAIASGNYSHEIPYCNYEDVDSVIKLMNNMAAKVRENDEELRKLNTRLEVRVAERTHELENSLSEVKEMQNRLVESGKLSALGQLSAGIAHELNTPLGAIMSSSASIIEYIDTDIINHLKVLNSISAKDSVDFFSLLALGINENKNINFTDTGFRTYKKIKTLLEKEGIEKQEVLASAIMDIGLAENLNEIIPYLKKTNSKEKIDIISAFSLMRRMIAIVQESAIKSTSVIEALRSYLIRDVKTETQIIDVDSSIRSVLTLMQNLLKHGVKLHTSFGSIKVMAFADSLSLVWINLIRNAAQAMGYEGDLYISTKHEKEKAVISIRDTGHGIPPNIIEKIFDPFFTTKHSGEGMGLGLDICKRIVETYNGTISVVSEVKYTEFTVSFPAVIE